MRIWVLLALITSGALTAAESKTEKPSASILSPEEAALAPFNQGDDHYGKRARLFKEIRANERVLTDIHSLGLASAVGAGAGYITWQVAETKGLRNAGLSFGIGSLLVHEYFKHFVLLPKRREIINQRYILGAQWNGTPALKRKPKMDDTGYLSGTNRMMRSEYIYDGYFWAAAFGAHGTVFTYNLAQKSNPYTSEELGFNIAFLVFSAGWSTLKFYWAYYWDKTELYELRRLHMDVRKRPTGANNSTSSLPDLGTNGQRREGSELYMQGAASHRY